MKKTLLPFLFLITCSVYCIAQPAIQWQKSLGGSFDDGAISIKQTADGGYIVAGWSNSNDGDVTGNHGGRDYWVVKLSPLTGIEELNAAGISVYPNPANDLLIINSANQLIGEIKIFDATGKLMRDQVINKNSLELNINEFNPGIYFIEINGYRLKIMKN